MPLKQRNQNPLNDETLMKMIDTVCFEVQDDDLIILNQLAVITRLANRKPFSLDDHQMTVIHSTLRNMFYQNSACIRELDACEMEEDRYYRKNLSRERSSSPPRRKREQYDQI